GGTGCFTYSAYCALLVPMSVLAPWPGITTVSSGRGCSLLTIDCTIVSTSPAADVLPGPPSNSVSPLITARPTRRQMLPGVCPGVWITVQRTPPTATSSPSATR